MAPNMSPVGYQGMLNSELKAVLDSRTDHRVLADWVVKQQSIHEHKFYLWTQYISCGWYSENQHKRISGRGDAPERLLLKYAAEWSFEMFPKQFIA